MSPHSGGTPPPWWEFANGEKSPPHTHALEMNPRPWTEYVGSRDMLSAYAPQSRIRTKEGHGSKSKVSKHLSRRPLQESQHLTLEQFSGSIHSFKWQFYRNYRKQIWKQRLRVIIAMHENPNEILASKHSMFYNFIDKDLISYLFKKNSKSRMDHHKTL